MLTKVKQLRRRSATGTRIFVNKKPRAWLSCSSKLLTKGMGNLLLTALLFMAGVIDSMANFMNKVADWLTLPAIPWDKFGTNWNKLVDAIAPWNRIFPLTDLMIIMGLVIAFSIALMIFYTVVLIKSFIPFSGGK